MKKTLLTLTLFSAVLYSISQTATMTVLNPNVPITGNGGGLTNTPLALGTIATGSNGASAVWMVGLDAAGKATTNAVPSGGGGGGGGSTNLTRWFNVKDYGAIGDGTNDDTASIKNANAAMNAAGGGTLYFPTPQQNYRITDTIWVTTNCCVTGDSVSYYGYGGTRIVMNSTTKPLFIFTNCVVSVEKIGLVQQNTAADVVDQVGSTSYSTSQFNADCVEFAGGLIGLSLSCSTGGTIHNCRFMFAVFGLFIQNPGSPDSGDNFFSDDQFYPTATNTTGLGSAITILSSGGSQFSNIKINGYGAAKYSNGFHIIPTGGNTSILNITGGSIENVASYGIVTTASGDGSTYDMIGIDNVEFLNLSGGQPIYLSSGIGNHSTISNCRFIGAGPAKGAEAFFSGMTEIHCSNFSTYSTPAAAQTSSSDCTYNGSGL